MQYQSNLTKQEAKRLSLSTRRAVDLLAREKFVAHNIFVDRVKKVALCDENNELKHIITRKAYIIHLCPTLF